MRFLESVNWCFSCCRCSASDCPGLGRNTPACSSFSRPDPVFSTVAQAVPAEPGTSALRRFPFCFFVNENTWFPCFSCHCEASWISPGMSIADNFFPADQGYGMTARCIFTESQVCIDCAHGRAIGRRSCTGGDANPADIAWLCCCMEQ